MTRACCGAGKRRAAVLVLAALLAAPAALAAPYRVSGAEDSPAVPFLAAGPRGFAAVWSTTPAHPADNAGELYFRMLATDGRPTTPVRRLSHMGRRFGEGVSSAFIAYNPRSRRYLVLWDGTGPRERIRPCGPSFPGTPAPPCSQPDLTVYARVLDARGRALDHQHHLTRAAPRDATLTHAGVWDVIAQPRSGGFLVAYVSTVHGALVSGVFAVGADGHRRAGASRLGPPGCARCIVDRLAPWGDGALAEIMSVSQSGDDEAVLLRALDARGRPAGAVREVLAGGGVAGAALATTHGRALAVRERDDRDTAGLSHFSIEARPVGPGGAAGPTQAMPELDDPELVPTAAGWELLGIREGGLQATPLSAAGEPAGAVTPLAPAEPHRFPSRVAVAASTRLGALAVWRNDAPHSGGTLELYSSPIPGTGLT
jgi:hypothetical protein